MDSPTSLYRHFDDAGALLYVGISLSWPARTRAHAQGSRWFEQVAKVEIEHFPTRALALEAERKAIQSESPKFNVVHNRGEGLGPQLKQRRPETIRDPLLKAIAGPHAIVGPALVYGGDNLSVMIVHGQFGTPGDLVEIVLGEFFPDTPAWTEYVDTVVTIRRANEITLSEARDRRQELIAKLRDHLEVVQDYSTDLALTVAYASQFPSERSRRLLDQVATEKGVVR